MPNRKTILFTTVALFISILIALAGVEFLLRLSDFFTPQPTATLPDYPDTWRPVEQGLGEGGFLLPNFDALVVGGSGEPVHWKTNAAGFRSEKEFTKSKPAGTLRILALGDSFTAGYRVDQSHTYGYRLERLLAGSGDWDSVEVLIACIEDPAYGLYYLQEYGLAYQPDVVLMTISLGNDFTETYLRLDLQGDFAYEFDGTRLKLERRESSGTVRLWDELDELTLPPEAVRGEVRYSKQDSGNFFLRHSRLYGMISTYMAAQRQRTQPQPITSGKALASAPLWDLSSGLGYYLKEPPVMLQTAYTRLFQVIDGYRHLCAQNGLELVIALHPQRFQVQLPDWRATVEFYRLEESLFDRQQPNERLRQFCAEHHLRLIDPTAPMAEIYGERKENLYLPLGDMHWNERGHEAMAGILRAALQEILPEFKPPAEAAAQLQDP